jgi:hypothetical protein
LVTREFRVVVVVGDLTDFGYPGISGYPGILVTREFWLPGNFVQAADSATTTATTTAATHANGPTRRPLTRWQ